MSADVPHSVRPLLASEALQCLGFTFPAFRSLLLATGRDDVIAWVATDPAGQLQGLALGALAQDAQGFREVELLSLYVRPPCRRSRVGSLLLQAFIRESACRGADAIFAKYMTQQAHTPAVESMLASSGWTAPETRMLVVTASLESIRHAPWIRDYKLAPRMKLVPWADLVPEQLDRLRSSEADTRWIPSDLHPLDFQNNLEPVTSVALLVDDAIAGWVINHRIDGYLRFSCSYMRPDLQRLGRILVLYNYAVDRMPLIGVNTGIWTVPVHHVRMVDFAKRWMAPYATSFGETRGSRLVLKP